MNCWRGGVRDAVEIQPVHAFEMAHFIAPSSGPTKGQCLGQALKSDGNGVSLALDVAGVGAGFLPGGGLVTGSARAATFAFGAQLGLTAASTGVGIAYKSGGKEGRPELRDLFNALKNRMRVCRDDLDACYRVCRITSPNVV
jgi:hypothetical protein